MPKIKEHDEIFEKMKSLFMGESSEPYSDKVVSLAYEPKNVGAMKDADCIGTVCGSCGDTIHLYLRLCGDNISEATFLTDGCGATLACGSVVTELVRGKSGYEALKITVQDVIGYLDGLPASHVHCAVLAVQALHDAIKNSND